MAYETRFLFSCEVIRAEAQKSSQAAINAMLTEEKKNENRKLASMPNLACYTVTHSPHQQPSDPNRYTENLSRFYIRLHIREIFFDEKNLESKEIIL
jgi:hypothetical protein